MKPRVTQSQRSFRSGLPRDIVYVEHSSWFERILIAFLMVWVIMLNKSTSDATDNNNILSGSSGQQQQQQEQQQQQPQFAVTYSEYPKWQNKNGVVHILTTRFMQLQPNLLNLGKARLDLFKTFTFPSIEAQTTKEFLWIIFTDPKLDPSLLDPLVELLKPHEDHIILLGTNTNFKDFAHDDWLLPDVKKAVFAGDLQKLIDYKNAANRHVFLETRLDADDSIFRNLMLNVQVQARQAMLPQPTSAIPSATTATTTTAALTNWLPSSLAAIGNGPVKTSSTTRSTTEVSNRHDNPIKTGFLVFCAPTLLEWGYFNPWEPSSTKGYLLGVVHDDFCVTPGLTYAYGVGTRSEDFPTRAHHKINKVIPRCAEEETGKQSRSTAGDNNGVAVVANSTINCVSRIALDQRFEFAVLRSRTPTSTSMDNVIPSTHVTENKEWRSKQEETWSTIVGSNFAVSPQAVFDLRSDFEKNMKPILQDALDGQCTRHEFTCKNSTNVLLLRLLDKVKQNS